MTAFFEVTTVDITNIQTVELIHMVLSFYNVTSIRVLASMITVLCEATIMLCIFPTVFNQSLVCIIWYFLFCFSNSIIFSSHDVTISITYCMT